MISWIKKLAFALAWPAAFFANAQTTHDTSPIRWIIASQAGSGLDIVSRVIANEASKSLGAPIVIDNKPGASGVTSAVEGARSVPNGRNFLITTVGPLVNNVAVFNKLPYDPARDFVSVSYIGRLPFGLYVRSDSPYRTLADLVADAKARPKALNFGNVGTANLTNLGGEHLAASLGYQYTAVPFSSEPPMMLALMSGQIDVVPTVLSGGIPHIKSGKIRALAVLDEARFPLLPDVPTARELGVRDVEVAGVPCMVAPAGTPRDAVLRMNKAVNDALSNPEVIQRMRELSMVPHVGPPEALDRIMKTEGERWIPLIKRLGIREGT